jgi:hypothetical protein
MSRADHRRLPHRVRQSELHEDQYVSLAEYEPVWLLHLRIRCRIPASECMTNVYGLVSRPTHVVSFHADHEVFWNITWHL